jgi:hypothetical protein
MNRQLGLILCATLASASSGQTAREARLVALTPAQARAATDKIVTNTPKDQASPDASAGQNFVLRASGVEDLTLIPGDLTVNKPERPTIITMQCGLYVLNAQGKSDYIPVIGPDYKPYSWCEQLDGVGLAADPGPRPRVILIYLLRALSGRHYDLPFVLQWDASHSTYKFDIATSSWLAEHPPRPTVAAVRSLLAREKK